MKKAVVIGGSNGIGLAITKNLVNKNYNVFIVDKNEPDMKLPNTTFLYMNLVNLDSQLLEELTKDTKIDLLMITAGFGRVANFEELKIEEIVKLIQVNELATIEIIKLFYDRIIQDAKFYCGVMTSISGMISSPMFSVYSATKAALFRFIESINIELEMKGTSNRILNVSPSSIQGTKFNGDDNNLDLLSDLANEIVCNLFESKELFIPQYEEILKDVIKRYNTNPHEFGLQSYEYKYNSGRITHKPQIKIGYLSGTFDLFHVGHLNLLRRAKEKCDYLIVGVHPSAAHKGKETFIPFDERKEIVAGCKYVDKVVESVPEDSDAWEQFHYDMLFVGSDYKGTERFNRYEEFLKDKNVEIVYFPYTQQTSSTQIREAIISKTKK